MRRATFVLGLTSTAVAGALVALAYGIGSQAQQTLSDADLADESATRNLVRDQTTRDVREAYSLLLEHLDLAPREKDVLLELLIEDRIAGTMIYSRGKAINEGKAMNEHERSNRIAAIIGYPKLQQFLALERNLFEYAEVQRIGSLLQQNGVPLTDTQRDGLFKILVETRGQYKTMPPSDAKRGSIESLEHRLSQQDEYGRHVLELAPSVLSPKQAQYLSEQYQYLSYQRADALEAQRKARADHTIEDGPVWYPAWGN